MTLTFDPDLLRAAILEKYGKLQDFAEKIDMSGQQLSNYLAGRRTPSGAVLARFRAAGIDVDNLFSTPGGVLLANLGHRQRNRILHSAQESSGDDKRPIVEEDADDDLYGEFDVIRVDLSKTLFYGEVLAGRPADLFDQGDPIPFSEFVGLPPETVVMRVRGRSMVAAGLMPGDVVMVKLDAPAGPGDLVAAQVGNNGLWLIKRLTHDQRLISEYATKRVIHKFKEEVVVRGRVVGKYSPVL